MMYGLLRIDAEVFADHILRFAALFQRAFLTG